MRSWFGGWNSADRAKLLVASLDRLSSEELALREAADVAQQKRITAHILRGCDFESAGDVHRAYEEFEIAARIDPTEALSKSIAAGCARRAQRTHDEIEMLALMKRAGEFNNCAVTRATALRREAELQVSGGELGVARDKLDEARAILLSVGVDDQSRAELGRISTLYCEVQYARNAYGNLGPRRREALNCSAGQAMTVASKWERGGKVYGDDRAKRIDANIEADL